MLDVHLEEALGEVAARDERGAAHAAALFVAEHDDRALADTLDRLDRGDDAERAVEFAAVGNRVEVRPAPHVRLLRAADQVAGRVDLDLQSRIAHPAGGEIVCVILVRRPADTVRAAAAAEGVQLVQPLQDSHGRIISTCERLGSDPWV